MSLGSILSVAGLLHVMCGCRILGSLQYSVKEGFAKCTMSVPK